MKDLIMQAYQVSEGQVLGGPGWLTSEGFDIEARTEKAGSPQEIRAMLRALLSERFGLRVSAERKPLRVQALVSGKAPLSLIPTVSPDASAAIAIRAANARSISVAGKNVTLPFLASWLSGRLHRIVTDDTGLTGSLDFTVDLTIDPEDAGNPDVAERDAMNHIFESLPGKLGLRLQARIEPVPTLTVEHAEKPSEN